jgi:hypothetical protein
MIANERQYRITKRELRNFEGAVAALLAKGEDTPPDDALFRQLQLDAMRSQIADLRAEVGEYEALKAGERPVQTVDAFDRLPQALIAARIAAGLTQADPAKRLGIHVQQVQRYEASGYAAASMQRVTEVVHALGVGVRIDVALPPARSQDPV